MEEKLTFTLTNDEGKVVECDILFTFEDDVTQKNYIIYTDNLLDETGCTKVYASTYDPLEEFPRLYPIETEEEWKMIEELLDDLQQQAQPVMDDEFFDYLAENMNIAISLDV